MQLDAGEIQTAKRILASRRRELRECLWDLRSHALDAENFANAIRETLHPQTCCEGIQQRRDRLNGRDNPPRRESPSRNRL